MKVVVGFIMMISCTVVANLFMKIGATVPHAERLFGLVSWTLVAGLTAFGCAAILYAWLLHSLPLNLAQSFAAAQFIAVILASALVLAEDIPPLRWVGIALITCGILIVGVASGAPR